MAEIIQNSGMSLQPKEKQKQGTGYTNIQRVLGANVGNKLGSAVRSGIQGQAQGVQQQTQQAKSQFETGVAEGRLDTAESKSAREAAIGRLSGPDYKGPSEEEIQQFSKFRGGQYGGPRAIQNEQELLSRASDVSGMARGLGTAEGRQGILQQFVGNAPSYSAGKSAMDQLLLGRSGDDIRAARAAASGLGRSTYQDIASARETGRAAERSAAAFGQETGRMLESETGTLDAEIQRQMTEAAQNEEARKGTLASIQGLLNPSAAISGKMVGAKPGQQVVGGATRQINPGAEALAQLESSGLLSPDELVRLKASQSGYGKIAESVNQMLKARAEKVVAGGKDRNRRYGEYKKALEGGPEALRKLYSGFEDANLAAFDVGESDFGGVLGGLLSQYQDTQDLGIKEKFVDPNEAIKFNALSKLAGKATQYREDITPEELFRSGGIDLNASKLASLAKTQQELSKGIAAGKYINPYGGLLEYSNEGQNRSDAARKLALAERERLAVLARQLKGKK